MYATYFYVALFEYTYIQFVSTSRSKADPQNSLISFKKYIPRKKNVLMGPVGDIKKANGLPKWHASQKRLSIFTHLGLFLDTKFGKGRSEKTPTQKP